MCSANATERYNQKTVSCANDALIFRAALTGRGFVQRAGE